MNTRVGLRLMVWGSAVAVAVNAALADSPSLPFLLVTALGIALWLTATALRVTDQRVQVVCFVAAGLCGAAMDVLYDGGTGWVLSFTAASGMGLRMARRPALVGGSIIIAATALTESYLSQNSVSAFFNLAIGGGFLFLTSQIAQVTRIAARDAEARLAREAEAREAREEAARLAERGRIARELHDVLAHTLSGLAVQLEGARLLAEKTGADPRLVTHLGEAHHLARDGVAAARSVVETLRGAPLPGPDRIPDLVAGSPVETSLTLSGTPKPLAPERGLALYRTVQEALTNTAKHAGPGARARVVLTWDDAAVTVEITDTGGPGGAALPSGGYGLTGLAERAALAGGLLTCGPSGAGWRVHLTLPLGDAA